MMKFSEWCIALVLSLAGMFLVGCGDETHTAIDVTGAEFSSEESYAQYDQEMAELSAGQEP
jgi:hypothetical protein